MDKSMQNWQWKRRLGKWAHASLWALEPFCDYIRFYKYIEKEQGEDSNVVNISKKHIGCIKSNHNKLKPKEVWVVNIEMLRNENMILKP